MTARTPLVARAAACLCLLGVLLGSGPLGAASASCTGPVLGVGGVADGPAGRVAAVLVPGAEVTVSGIRFHSGCDDTGQGAGCGAPESEQAPLTRVALVLEQGATSVTLGTADAGGPADGYAISWRVRVPTGFAPGPAELMASGARLPVELGP